LRDQKKDSYKSCYDQKCQIELGRELAAEMSLSTQVMKIGDTCQVAAVLYNLKKATAVQAVTKGAPCQDHELLKAVKSVADELGKQLEGKQISSVLQDVMLGTLVVQTEPPGAQVFIDGESSGTTPFTTQIKGGEYTVKVVEAEHEPQEQTVDLEAGKKAKVSLKLVPRKFGTLNVVTKPEGAAVTVDGQAAGTSPLKKELKAGNYLIAVKKEGYLDLEQQVKLDWEIQTKTELELTSTPSHNMWGHISFWSGVGMLALGGLAAYLSMSESDAFEDGDMAGLDGSRTWAGVMYTFAGIGTGLMATGVTLWILAPPVTKVTAPPAGPSREGRTVGLSLGGRW
jgi:hypothetical protein